MAGGETMVRGVAIVPTLVWILAAVPSTDARPESAESEVRAAVEAFGRAFVAADTVALRSFLGAAYMHVNGRSGTVLSKEQWLDWISSRREEQESGALRIEKYDLEELRVEIYDQTAVVTGIADSRGTHHGEAFASRVRFTNVWVFDRSWRRVAFHDSPLE